MESRHISRTESQACRQLYLNEFLFRCNHRFHRYVSLAAVLGITLVTSGAHFKAMKAEMKVFTQTSSTQSPWTLKERVCLLAWDYVWLLFCSWTPKPANNWRLFWMRCFGARIQGRPFVHQRARIQIPWNVSLGNHSCLGDRANIYSLGRVEIQEYATVAQEAYLCTATHAFERRELNLITNSIIIGAGAFVGARAFLMPGVTIGEWAIVGACSVVTKQVLPREIVAGNPAKKISVREIGGGNPIRQ